MFRSEFAAKLEMTIGYLIIHVCGVTNVGLITIITAYVLYN